MTDLNSHDLLSARVSSESSKSGKSGEISRELEANGLRPTRQRIAICSALKGCHSHPTADELHHLVAAQREAGAPAISLATVYNTLQALSRKRMCRSIPTGDAQRWDAGVHNHVHVQLDDAKELVDLPDDLGDRLLEQIPAELLERIGQVMGMHIDGVAIQLTARRMAGVSNVP